MVPIPACCSCLTTHNNLLDVQNLNFTYKLVQYEFSEVLAFCLNDTRSIDQCERICPDCYQQFRNVYILRKRLFHQDLGQWLPDIKEEPLEIEIDIKTDPEEQVAILIEPIIDIQPCPPSDADCVFCPAKFNTRLLLKQHTDIEHEDENPAKSELLEYLQEIDYSPVSYVPIFKCRACCCQFAVYYEFKVHVFTEHKLKERLIFCNVCQLPFSNMQLMLEHRKEHTAFGEATNHADISIVGQDTFKAKVEYMDIEMANVSETTSIAGCIWCGAVFSELEALKKHFLNKCTDVWSKNAGLELLNLWKKACEAAADQICVQCNASQCLLLHIFSRTFVSESGAVVSMRKAFRVSTGRTSTPKMLLCETCEAQVQLKYERLTIDEAPGVEFVGEVDISEAPDKKFKLTELPHKCLKCSKRFDLFVNFESHMLEKHEETVNLFACQSCSQIFFEVEDLYNHEKARHGIQISAEALEFCDICSRRFSDEESLKRHIFVDHPGKPCPYCGKRYNARNLRVNHIDKAHTFCKICRLSFANQAKYQEHHEIHLECPHCKKRFNNIPNTRRHIATVHEGEVIDHKVPTHMPMKRKVKDELSDEMLVCDFCGERCATKKDMIQHMVIHRSDVDLTEALLTRLQRYEPKPNETFKCPICVKEYQMIGKFRKHLYWHRAHKNQSKNSYLCLFCARSFNSKNSLDYHTSAQHTNVKPKKVPKIIFKRESCKICHKVILKVSMRDHMQKIHKIGFDYKCRLCKQSFESVDAMWKHYAAEHTAVQTTCEVCHRRFKTWELKFQHSFDHRGFKPYVCPKMDCYFKTKYVKQHRIHLKKRHDIDYDERIHGYRESDAERIKALQESKILPADGHDPYAKKYEFQCTQCFRSYEKETSLQKHFQKMHGKSTRSYTCSQCDYTHKDRLSAYRHCFNHLGYKPYQCFVDGCTVGTKVKKLYQIHLKKHHNIEYDEAEHGFKGSMNEIINKIFK